MVCTKCYGKGVTHHYEKGIMEVQQCECELSSKNDSSHDLFDSVIKRYADVFKISYKRASEELGVL